MKAMILAAGLGTRLRPLTNDRPKALVQVAGRSLLQIALSRLRSFGVDEVIINVHHFAEQIVDHLEANDNFGMHIQLSREELLLDTGGGLKKAAWFFDQDSAPFLVHNVDVISTIDLRRMVQHHVENHALATLAVQERQTSRQLIFDEHLNLCGRRADREQTPELVRTSATTQSRAFSGIHVISPRLLSMITEAGAFSIIKTYLRLAAQGEKIMAFPSDQYYWRDLGKPENVTQAEHDFREKVVVW